ncbi:hypothetical protein CFC21_108786 [Triticum aestivum]|uniref:DUF241 domain-containing protein n=3 Tax=Triticinae TaxID=1648030 RepID=A0A453TAV0_AEGTS|nr:uncharacterized protein LOC109783168 [Aegilops tauschii subsp. strangulata]XP_044444138.1 uncharacterized protein LOC123170354 [Triticum aestivum]KAF7108289.1 hypothetical protein CFC21_108786 [Triticum aestivum]
MAPNFGRSISFPLTPARSFSKSSRHVRSVSLPGTTSSHPLLANLHAHIAAVRSWIQDTASLQAGLANIHALHAALADLLLLPASVAALRCTTSNTGDRLLDAFLLLADAHQGFQECLLELRQAAAESRTALRRGDAGRLASASSSQRRAEKDLARLAASVSAVSTKCARLNLVAVSGEEAEMAYALVEAAAASAAASAAVFSAAASMSSAVSSCKKTATFIPAFARKSTAPESAEATVERLHALEQCFDECDGACDMVFRSVVQTRVSLLNIMTPTI